MLIVPPTARVLTENVAVVDPAGTVTLPGTVPTDASLLDKLTTVPPEGAAADSVTVPVTALPPTTEDDARLMFARLTDVVVPVIVSGAVLVAPPEDAEIVGVPAETVVTVKVALELPLATATDAGTVAEALLDETVTLAPPELAGHARLTVP